MAGRCKQCSIATNGRDLRQLANIVTRAEAARGEDVAVTCDGCGPCLVDINGICVECEEGHEDKTPLDPLRHILT